MIFVSVLLYHLTVGYFFRLGKYTFFSVNPFLIWFPRNPVLWSFIFYHKRLLVFELKHWVIVTLWMWYPNSKFSHSKKIILKYFSGSENNSLYLYYKGLSKTLLTFKFDTVKSVLDKDRKEDDTNEFVSAVCWRALPDGVSFYISFFTLVSHIMHYVYVYTGKFF